MKRLRADALSPGEFHDDLQLWNLDYKSSSIESLNMTEHRNNGVVVPNAEENKS